MPDHAAHYVYASDSAWSYDPAHHRQASAGASSGSRASRVVGEALEYAGVWLGAQVWRGVGWLLRAPMDSSRVREDEEDELGWKSEKEETRAEGRLDVGREVVRPLPGDASTDARHPTQSEGDNSVLPRTPPSPPTIGDDAFLLSELSSPQSTPLEDYSTPDSISSTCPLLETSTRPGAHEFDVLDDQADCTPPRPPPKDDFVLDRLHGSIVYVRMSDGRLVRRLSTIASESEGAATRRSRSDLTGSA